MGKINEYQRKQLASSAVGIAPEDKSGQTVGKAIEQFGGAVVTRAQKIDEYDTLQANTAVMQFGLSFQKLGTQTQLEMAANPDGYGEKLLEGGNTLLENYASQIEDQGVRAKFMKAGQTILRAGVKSAPGWVEAKKLDNAKIASKDAFRIASIATGNTLTKAEYVQNVETTRKDVGDKIGDDVMSASDKKAEVDKLMPGALDSHFGNRIMQDPEQLIKDLNSKNSSVNYEDAPYYEASMKNKYIKQAEGRIRNRKTEVRQLQDLNGVEANNAFIAGSLTFTTLDAMINAPNEEDRITSTLGATLKKGLVSQAMVDGNKLYKSEPDARKYLDMIDTLVSDNIKKAEMNMQIAESYTQGVASRQESTFFTTTVKELNTLKGAQQRKNMAAGVRLLKDRVQQIWGDEPTTAAGYMREFVEGVATGVNPQIVTQGILRKMAADKVIEDNPNLAASENPVDDAYGAAALKVLTDNGYPTDKANVEALKAQLKEEDNAKKE